MTIPTEVKKIESWEDADRALLALRVTTAQIEQVSAIYDQRIQEAQEEKSKALKNLQARKERMEEVLEDFSVTNREGLGRKKSLKLVHGRIGFRKGAARLEFTRDEAHTQRMLKLRNHDDCLHTATEVVKNAVKKLPDSEMQLCGVTLVQEEKYFYELHADPPITYPEVASGEPQADAG